MVIGEDNETAKMTIKIFGQIVEFELQRKAEIINENPQLQVINQQVEPEPNRNHLDVDKALGQLMGNISTLQ